MSDFIYRRSEQFLTCIQDTGVAGATLSVKLVGKHVFFELKSTHAVMTIINNRVADIKKLRKALHKAEKEIHAQAKERKEIISRSSADIQIAEARKKASADSSRASKKAAKGGGKEKAKKTISK